MHAGGKRKETHRFVLLWMPSSPTQSCKVKVKVTQSCLTLCYPLVYTVHGILQARILEWVAFPFSRGSSQPRDQAQVPPHCRQILYQLSHKRSPGILEWVACPFSRGSSLPRNQTRVSCIAGRSFTNWAPREAQANHKNSASLVKSVANYYLTTRLLQYERDPCGPSLKYKWAEAT